MPFRNRMVGGPLLARAKIVRRLLVAQPFKVQRDPRPVGGG
jgi:hypothetical protein